MRQIIAFIIMTTITVTASTGFAAKSTKTSTSKKENKKNAKILTEVNRWNRVCQDLLETSVQSTRKLEKSVQRKKSITPEEFDQKVHNELLVVQLNAWVCAASSESQKSKLKKGIAAEELFLRDYSRLVQSKKL
jgi:hypothetical protein